MKICLVLLASLVAVAYGHKTDGGSYSEKKAEKLSLKESLIDKIHNIKDKIHAKIATKKEKIHAKKAHKHGNLGKGAQPAVDCSTVMDEVWEERCDTKYEPVCRMEMQPHCTSIQAKECAPESQTRCSFVFEDKCKTISVPKCTIDWEKRCTSTPDCTTVDVKSCTEVEKDVCVTHMDKSCTMSTVNVCRKVAVREFTPEDDAVERVGLKASIKAKAAAHKAQKSSKLAEKLALKGIPKAHTLHKRQITDEDDFYVCEADGKKIPISYKCNDFEDCSDGGDEKDCDTEEETPEFFYCRDGINGQGAQNPQNLDLPHQIPYKQKCDGNNDCEDHSDEDRITCPINPKHEASVKDHLKLKRDRECEEEWAAGKRCKSDNLTLIAELLAEKNAADYKLALHWRDLDPESRQYVIKKDNSKATNLEEEYCKTLVAQKRSCADTPIDHLYELRALNKTASWNYFYLQEGFEIAQKIKRGFRLPRSVDQTATDEQDFLVDLDQEALDMAEDGSEVLEAGRSLNRTPRSLKGDIAGDKTDIKGRLETFKAGFKAAKDQYHEAKARFKATTKALVHAKLNKGDKGLKASLPTIRVRYEKSCQDEPRKICTNTPRQDCHKEVVPLCKTEPRETCVPKEKCKSWPQKNCEMVHKETCLPFPTKKCTEISTPVCKVVPRQECTEKKHEICETVPNKVCQKVLVSKPRTVCIPRPTTRTIEDW